MKTREQIRNERAELVCRELRFQLARPDSFMDFNKSMELLKSWMKVAKKNKYDRP